MTSNLLAKIFQDRSGKPNVWAQQCRLCWERLEWKAWPDTQTPELISTMAHAWKQLPAGLRQDRWGQPLVPAIEAAWAQALRERKSEDASDLQS